MKLSSKFRDLIAIQEKLDSSEYNHPNMNENEMGVYRILLARREELKNDILDRIVRLESLVLQATGLKDDN